MDPGFRREDAEGKCSCRLFASSPLEGCFVLAFKPIWIYHALFVVGKEVRTCTATEAPEGCMSILGQALDLDRVPVDHLYLQAGIQHLVAHSRGTGSVAPPIWNARGCDRVVPIQSAVSRAA